MSSCWWWLSALLVIPAGVLLIPDPLLAVLEWYEPRVVFRGPPATRRGKLGGNNKPLLALSIDDVPCLGDKRGPRRANESHLGAILALLRRHGARATFMLMSHEDGQRWHSDAVRRAVDEGHELGNHGVVDEKHAALAPAEFEQRLAHCDALLAKLQPGFAARPRRWFRPGAGAWTKPMLAHAAAMGYTAVLASVYPLLELRIPQLCRGWRLLGQATESFGAWLSAVFVLARARPGAIIVLHDRWHTPRTLERVLPQLAKRFRIVTLSSLFEGGGSGGVAKSRGLLLAGADAEAEA
jgi:peptidoglycan/xylan/chitin deacetylase (PgdA/CDA1 family)